jgi:hypothetical protein
MNFLSPIAIFNDNIKIKRATSHVLADKKIKTLFFRKIIHSTILSLKDSATYVLNLKSTDPKGKPIS